MTRRQFDVVHLVARLSNQKRAVKKLSRELRSDPTHVRKTPSVAPNLPKHVRLSCNEIAALAACFGGGATIQEAADIFGVHRTTARNHLMRLGLWPQTIAAQGPERIDGSHEASK